MEGIITRWTPLGGCGSMEREVNWMERVRMAVVGAGTWGKNHVQIYQAHPFAEVVAIADPVAGKAAALAGELGVPAAFTDVESMLDGCDCDAVAVVTPDFAHADATIAAVERGRHVLIEKPIATTRADLERMTAVLRGSDVRVMVDLHNRWNPPYHEAWRSVRAGVIGEVQSAYIRLNDTKWVATTLLPWAAESSILWFLGSHSVDTLRWIVGSEVRRVYAVKREGVLRELGVDTVDLYLTTLEFANGVVAQMENGWITPDSNPNVNDFRCSILGSGGQININASNHQLVELFTSEKLTVPDILVQNHVFGRPAGFAYQSIRSFVDCLLTGEDFHVTVGDAIRGVEVILAIMESAECGLPVEVDYHYPDFQ